MKKFGRVAAGLMVGALVFFMFSVLAFGQAQTGTLRGTVTDPNGQVTTASYNDALDRLTTITRPTGGGQTTYGYGDQVGNLFLHTQTTQDAAQRLLDLDIIEGLDHIVDPRIPLLLPDVEA